MDKIKPETSEMIANLQQTERNTNRELSTFESVIQKTEAEDKLDEKITQEQLRDEVSILVVRAFGPNKLSADGQKARTELEKMGLTLPETTDGLLLSEIVTKILEQMEKNNE